MKQYYGYLIDGILPWTLDYNTKEFKFHNSFFKNFNEYMKVFMIIEIVIFIVAILSLIETSLLKTFYFSLFVTFIVSIPLVIYNMFSKKRIKKDAYKSILYNVKNQLIKKKISNNIFILLYKGYYLDYYFTRDFSRQIQLIKSYEENKICLAYI